MITLKKHHCKIFVVICNDSVFVCVQISPNWEEAQRSAPNQENRPRPEPNPVVMAKLLLFPLALPAGPPPGPAFHNNNHVCSVVS